MSIVANPHRPRIGIVDKSHRFIISIVGIPHRPCH
jgi:hypothetical protein